ncbi:AGE family epimerase/isomerase [Priestia megaterium]
MQICTCVKRCFLPLKQQEIKILRPSVHACKGVTQQLAERSGGMIWEHYDTDWQPDWDYNKNNTKMNFVRTALYQDISLNGASCFYGLIGTVRKTG